MPKRKPTTRTRGGARPGAGRPTAQTAYVNIRVPVEAAQAVKGKGNRGTRQRAVAAFVEAAMPPGTRMVTLDGVVCFVPPNPAEGHKDRLYRQAVEMLNTHYPLATPAKKRTKKAR